MDSKYARPPPNPDVYQTPEVDIKGSWDEASVKNKTFLITGGASGIGAGMAKKLAGLGGTVIIGDLQNAQSFVDEVRKSTGNPNIHSVQCDMTNYKSQCDMFRKALELSPKKAIDSVIANAGVNEVGKNFVPRPFGQLLPYPSFQAVPRTKKLSTVPGQSEDPEEPNLTTMNVNITGVIYTAYLAMQYFRGHPHLSTDAYPNAEHDRSIVFIGSIASLYPLTHAPFYNASKHAVLGLFRSLRQTAKPDRVRVNLLCPYWIETPIIPLGAKVLLAGTDYAQMEDVVDIGVRCLGDYSVAGHIFLVLPRSTGGVVEIFNDEPKDLDTFNRNAVYALNKVSAAQSWIEWGKNVVLAMLGLYRS
ncbi:hypothetical protein H072_9630 [Dactylellina haptotyla CBS 200.50]|uniref:Uncharacterized protein n=1 Tax=Dactylellina haptotyla (strain CBS 200.50) TaxID=1284197 RepID=S8BCC8_DACHA|nr:hypothetical protein H072_9630 [Dactylellina haptotyla CBS 200.50]